MLHHAVGYLKYGRLMCLLLLLGGLSGACYYVFSPAVYFSRALIDYKFFALPVAADGVNGESTSGALRSVMGQLGSRQMLAWTAHKLGVGNKNASYEELRSGPLKKVEVNILDAATLQFSVFSTNPNVVREFPQALINQYADYTRTKRFEFFEIALKRYNEELKLLKDKIDASLQSKTDFERQNDVNDLLLKQNTLAQVPLDILRIEHKLRRYEEVSDILKERLQHGRVDAMEQLSLLETAKSASLGDNPVGNLVVPQSGDLKDTLLVPTVGMPLPSPQQTVVVQPSMVDGLRPWQQLEKERREVAEKVTEALRTYLEGHAVVQQLRTRQRQIEESLVAELDVEKKRFEVEHLRLGDQLRELQEKMPEYSAMTEKVNKLRQDYSLGQQSDLAWSQAYADLAKNVARIQFGAEKDRIDLQFREFSMLRDVDPVSPTKSKLAVLAIVLGFGLAIGVPLGLEQLNDKITSLAALEKLTGLKGLGIVPTSNSVFLEGVTRGIESDPRKPNHVLECYRVLRAHLGLQLGNREGAKVVMFTSARPSEGKTVTAANLAWTLQSIGAKTLLVDLDFRKGRVHNLFGVDRYPGFCQALTGELVLEDVVRHTHLANFHYCTRGNTSAGSAELLCRLSLEENIAIWRQQYDWIILDTPPVLGLSETTNLQRVADAVVLIVKAEKTQGRDVTEAIDQLMRAGAPMAGFVLNNIDMSKVSNYYYYYYSSSYYYQSFEEDDVAGSSAPASA
jgi:capsular exopolysaccharide synthesis family protein